MRADEPGEHLADLDARGSGSDHRIIGSVRAQLFLALGFDVLRASLMADDAGVDLAQARKLVALGCPLDTASRILL